MMPVWVTGVGLATPIGLSNAEVTRSLREARSGIRLWSADNFAKSFPAGIVEGDFDAGFEKRDLPYLDRLTKLSLFAVDQALTEAHLANGFSRFAHRAGVFVGTVMGGAESEYAWLTDHFLKGKQTARPFPMVAGMPNAPASWISIRNQITGPVLTHTAACASSGVAIGDAMRWIRSGDLDIAIAGGCEASLVPPFMGAWDGLRALAKPDSDNVERSCRPFARDRAGLVLSEGAVFFVLESEESARQRGATPLAALSGYGVANDAHHIGSPHSRGQFAAMRSALTDAGLAPGDLSYINAHATATPTGDPVEVVALRELLGEHCDAVPVSSTKSLHGHLLGAASAMELAACLFAIRHDFLPPTAFLDDPDPACALRHIPLCAVPAQHIRHTLTLSAGFGGTNAALVLSRV